MVKSAVFIGGTVFGFALASAMTEQQRRAVRERAANLGRGERVQRLAGTGKTVAGAVADSALDVAEGTADKVADAVTITH